MSDILSPFLFPFYSVNTRMWFIFLAPIDHVQINDLSQVPVPVMLLPDDFKASTKIKVNNHLFNK